jgi:hypothetical protein
MVVAVGEPVDEAEKRRLRHRVHRTDLPEE